MRKFFTKKLAVAFTVSALAMLQVTGVAAAGYSDDVAAYSTETDSTKTDTTRTDTTKTDTTKTDTTKTDASNNNVADSSSSSDYSKPSYVAEKNIVDVDKVNEVLEDAIANSTESSITVATKVKAPVVSAGIFAKAKAANKDITISVTDENNRLMYSWTFKAAELGNTDKDVDLSLAFATDKSGAIEKLTGTNEVLYLSFNYHGELPGAASLHTYVGNNFKNGDVVYLYYYNEELGRIETVGDNKGIEVKDGYADFTINHCSVYFLSAHTADEVNAVNPATGEKVNDAIDTGDKANVMLYVLLSVLAVSAIAAVAVVEVRKAR